MKLKLNLFFLALASVVFCAEQVPVNWKQTQIIIPRQANPSLRLAAGELQKHLFLITGTVPEITTDPGKGNYRFLIGFAPQNKIPLEPEEGRWIISGQETCFYGDDHLSSDSDSAVFERNARTGTLFAVYDFLEKKCGVLWLEPGNAGIVYKRQPDLKLECGTGGWKTGQLRQREMRNLVWQHINAQKNLPEQMQWSSGRIEEYRRDVNLWLKRHRMGRSLELNYGHAFTDWFQRFGKIHPEYFAMQPDGVRRPEFPASPDTVKLCVSNPAVALQVIADWKTKKKRPWSVSVCENDSLGFCICPNCRKLDVILPEEKPESHLTDRYLHFSNRVQSLLAAEDPGACAVMYAYSAYFLPPRREKVDPRLIIGFVPSMLELGKNDPIYEAWRNSGARRMFWRPNDQHINTGLPMGCEKAMFDNFQLGIRNGIIGTDYDCLHNFWPATGIADYILARAHSDPSRNFEDLEDEYCSAFGDAKNEVKEFFRYWRRHVWEERILPQADDFRRLGINDNFHRGVIRNIDRCFKTADFDATDAILAKAVKRKLAGDESGRLRRLRLGNRHSRLTFNALAAKDSDKLIAGRVLLNFRKQYRDELNFDWIFLALREKQYGDCAGTQAALLLDGYDKFQPLQLQWMFKIDPENIGEKEGWEKLPYHRMVKWSPILTNASWERQTFRWMSEELRKSLRHYDGIGYYALQITIPEEWRGSEIVLFFGGVDESCKVYINGRLTGERVYRHPDDWKTPFAVRIDGQLDSSRPEQVVVVRVEDKAGDGGIWKPVYLAARTKAE